MRNWWFWCLSLATCGKSSANRGFSCFGHSILLHVLKLSRLTRHHRLIVWMFSWYHVPYDLMFDLHFRFQWCLTSAWRLFWILCFLLNKWILLWCSTFLPDFTNLFTTWFFPDSTSTTLGAAIRNHFFAQELRSKRRLRSFRKFGHHHSLLMWLLLWLTRSRSLHNCLELPIAIFRATALLISFKCCVALIGIWGIWCRGEWALASSSVLLLLASKLCKRRLLWMLWCQTISLTLRRTTMIFLSIACHRSIMPQTHSATTSLRWLWSLGHRFDRHRPRAAKIWLVLWVIITSLQMLIRYSFKANFLSEHTNLGF